MTKIQKILIGVILIGIVFLVFFNTFVSTSSMLYVKYTNNGANTFEKPEQITLLDTAILESEYQELNNIRIQTPFLEIDTQENETSNITFLSGDKVMTLIENIFPAEETFNTDTFDGYFKMVSLSSSDLSIFDGNAEKNYETSLLLLKRVVISESVGSIEYFDMGEIQGVLFSELGLENEGILVELFLGGSNYTLATRNVSKEDVLAVINSIVIEN